jgi:hypothetical protein
MNKLSFLKILFSPFKPFKLGFFIGKVRMGVPYFLPRRWIKTKDKPNYLTPIPKRIGFDFVGLGWKTKWSNTDYRFEYNPIISFVFFGLQICIFVKVEHEYAYWASWLYYEFNTDRSKSSKERIEQLKKEFPQNWTTYDQENGKYSTNYYDLILK